MAEHTSTFGSSAYGGGGWSERIRAHREEIGDLWTDCGIDNEWSRLRAVLLHRPGDELAASADEHDAMAEAFRANGVTVHYVEPDGPPSPNQMFCADLMFMTPEGVIVARPASTVRAGEER